MAGPNLEELLAQRLWDGIVNDAQAEAERPVSEAERVELDDRLRKDDEHPEQTIPWPEARARLRNGQ